MISRTDIKDLERALCNKPTDFKKKLLVAYFIFFSALLYYFLR